MDPILRAHLVSLGLNPNATEAEAKTFLDGLSAEQKTVALATLTQANPAAGITINLHNAPAPATQPKKPAPKGKTVAVVEPTENDVLEEPTVLQLEAKRVEDITSLATLYKLDADFIATQVAADADVPTARKAALVALAAKSKPVVTVTVGGDANLVSLSGCLGDAIRLRADQKVEKPHERAQQFRHLRLSQMGQHYLAAVGVKDAFMLSAGRVFELTMNPHKLRDLLGHSQIMLAESTSDFPSILADTINKTLRAAYNDAPSTWTTWARRATNPDFKTITRAALSESPDLKVRNESGEIKYVVLTDSKETYALIEYISGIKLTRRAMVNDDLDAFGRIPNAQGQAAKRKEDDVAYAIVTANANMSDGNAVFSVAHANLAGSGAAISVASLQQARTAIKKQKGLGGAARLELPMDFLLVPTSIEETATQLLGSPTLMPLNTTAGAANQGMKNPFATGLTLVGSTRLDDNSATAWYPMTDYRRGQVDTVEVCFMQDEPEPVLRSETDFDTEDMKFAVRHTVAAQALDYRGMYKNPGA